MNAHVLKFKNEKGEWVEIPYLVSDMYNMYVTYCREKGIEPVSQDDYYTSVGMLGTLVSQLADSTEAVQTLSEALNRGVLPTTLGGTGLEINDSLESYLKNDLLLVSGNTALEIAQAESNGVKDELLGKTYSGTKKPTERTDLDDSVEYYFQII